MLGSPNALAPDRHRLAVVRGAGGGGASRSARCATRWPASTAAGPRPSAAAPTAFDVERIATGFNRPTWVGVAPGDPEALWVLEQPGRVVRARSGGRRTTVIDLTGEVTTGAEQGLLGIAFHPDFATNRRLYLHWSDARGDTRVAEFRDGRQVRELLLVEQPEPNHNGGQLAFGPDGRLYVGLGDGGGAFDPERRAQDPRRQARQAALHRRRGDARLARRADRPAQPVALRVRPRARRGLDRRRRPGRRSRRSTACCSSPTSRRRTSAGARSRAPSAIGEGDDSLTDGELVWPVAAVHARRRLLGHRRLRLPGHEAAAAGRPLPVRRLLLGRPVVAQGRAGGPRGRRPARARRACRSSPTSAPTPTASRCSRPPPARSTARVSPTTALTGPSIQTRTRSPGCQAGKPSRRLRSRSPLGSSRCTSWSCP